MLIMTTSQCQTTLNVTVDESPRKEEGSKDENKEKEDKSCVCHL